MDNEYTNIFYSSALTMVGVMGLGFISRKTIKDPLGTPSTFMGSLINLDPPFS